jgi:hypothetical protein
MIANTLHHRPFALTAAGILLGTALIATGSAPLSVVGGVLIVGGLLVPLIRFPLLAGTQAESRKDQDEVQVATDARASQVEAQLVHQIHQVDAARLKAEQTDPTNRMRELGQLEVNIHLLNALFVHWVSLLSPPRMSSAANASVMDHLRQVAEEIYARQGFNNDLRHETLKSRSSSGSPGGSSGNWGASGGSMGSYGSSGSGGSGGSSGSGGSASRQGSGAQN